MIYVVTGQRLPAIRISGYWLMWLLIQGGA